MAEPVTEGMRVALRGAFWNTYARVYDAAWNTSLTAAAADAAVDAVAAPASAYIVDIGCGTGLFGRAFREQGHTVAGVDSSPVMLRRARDRARVDEVVKADAARTGLSNGRADVVLVANVLHLATDPGDILVEANRIAGAAATTRVVCVNPVPAITPAKVAAAERAAGRSTIGVLWAQVLRAHIALLADLSGAVRRPDRARLTTSLADFERSGWVRESSRTVLGCQEVRVYRRAGAEPVEDRRFDRRPLSPKSENG